MARILPDPSLDWPIALEAVELIAEKEGLSLKAYKCPAGVWTIGWGETEGVTPGDVITKEEADQMLLKDLQGRAQQVKALCTEWANEYQLGAMVSLAYNIGLEAFKKSTVLRKHNEGDFDAAARAFGLWNKARNPRTRQLEVLAGLTSRRAAEAALYLKMDVDNDAWRGMPQAVEAESSIVRSPIAQTGVVTGGTGAVIAAGSVFADSITPVIGKAKEFADTLGVQPLTVLGVVLLVAGAIALYQRYKQRDGGWA